MSFQVAFSWMTPDKVEDSLGKPDAWRKGFPPAQHFPPDIEAEFARDFQRSISPFRRFAFPATVLGWAIWLIWHEIVVHVDLVYARIDTWVTPLRVLVTLAGVGTWVCSLRPAYLDDARFNATGNTTWTWVINVGMGVLLLITPAPYFHLFGGAAFVLTLGIACTMTTGTSSRRAPPRRGWPCSRPAPLR